MFQFLDVQERALNNSIKSVLSLTIITDFDGEVTDLCL